jgi:hypothetical protein
MCIAKNHVQAVYLVSLEQTDLAEFFHSNYVSVVLPLVPVLTSERTVYVAFKRCKNVIMFICGSRYYRGKRVIYGFFFAGQAFSAVKTFEITVLGITQFICNLGKNPPCGNASFFMVVYQKIMHHCIRHTNVKEAQKLLDIVFLESMSCCQRACHPKLVIPVDFLHEYVTSFDCNVGSHLLLYTITIPIHRCFSIRWVGCCNKIHWNPILPRTNNHTIFCIHSYVKFATLGLSLSPKNHLREVAFVNYRSTTSNCVFCEHLGDRWRTVEVVNIDNHIC